MPTTPKPDKSLERLGYNTEIFGPPRDAPSLAAGRPWHIDTVNEVARRCVGGIVIGLPRWPALPPYANFATEYNHYEGAVLHTLDTPMLVLAQQDVADRCIFNHGAGHFITNFPVDADRSWLESQTFKGCF